jgi:hypothetical protein
MEDKCHRITTSCETVSFLGDPRLMEDNCHRITTSCEAVSFLFRQETPALWRTSVTETRSWGTMAHLSSVFQRYQLLKNSIFFYPLYGRSA